MARYIGPKTKLSRRFGEPLFGADKYFERKSYPPGLHGKMNKRRKQSVYGIQLNEKQKAKYIYGILERQFRRVYKKAARKEGVTGEIILQILESRLDNVVYRLGIAPTRAAARQLVSHKHIIVNENVVNIPSFEVKVGDIVGIREKSKSLQVITESLEKASHSKFNWLEWDNNLLRGKMINVPAREDIPEKINEQLIVELYSK